MIARRRQSVSRGKVSLVTGMERAAQIARSRLLFAAVVFAVGFVVMAARVVDVAILTDGNEPRLARVPAAAPLATGRADIVDRNGVLLATSLRAASLYADPTEIIDPAAAAAQLSSVLTDLKPAHIAAKLVQPKRFVWIKRHLTPAETFAVNRLGIPGLHFQTEERRVYPHGALAAHVTGFAGVDDTGLAGLEKALDSRIRGDQTPVRTSIDVRLQHIVRQEVQRQIDDFSAVGGVGVVMAVDSGEVHALVSLPDFDANRAEVTPPEGRFNRATLGVYEMGSTFKIFNTAMALESGAVTLRDGYDATKPIRIARFTISDYHAQKRWLSVPEIFMYSSNIGSVKIALDVGTEDQRAFLARLGFLDRLALELPETGTPMTPRPWRQINTMTISYGHGLSVTPLHLAGAVSTVVNGGLRHAPTLLAQDTPATGQRVFSADTSKAMRRLLRLVVKSGTGRNADARGFLVGGKTGTAEKSGVGGYRRKALLSSFVAAFPLNAPKFVILVMVDEPKGNERSHGYATGGWVAAPAVKRIVARMAPLYGILPIDENAPEIRRDLEMKLPTPKGGNRLASF
ncbi:MAG: penicillin-binding protein 2 [Pseudomonadota bacterium]|nr:penicillin-binding protein 2 [Pseudomonadota bacterium]